MLCPCVLQVAAESLVSYYRGMKRLKATCWFAQTFLSSHWYEPATQRNAVPGNAKWRKTSTAGELYLVPVFIWFPAHGFFITRFPQSSCCPSGIYTFFLFYQLFISQVLPGCFSEPLTFSGTARNATCFLLTVSPTMCRSRPTSTLLYTKKKVNGKAPKITRCNSLLFFCFFSHENIQVRGGIYTGKMCNCWLLLSFLSLWFLCWCNKRNRATSPPAV